MTPNREYVTDVPYVRGYEKHLSPMQLRLCAALNGFRSPSVTSFDFCELGCAQGDTIVALAASFPNARFVGIDLNPAHVATARTLASAGAVDNVRFIEGDFSDLRDGDLGTFDFMTAHGVLSWVSPDKRKIVLDLMSRKLKAGGLAYVSYNALPGWAAVEPLRQLILAGAALASGNSADRARAGLELTRMLDESGAYYFEANPAARKMLATMKDMSMSYVVHEYLHAHWVPMYFAQVAGEMAERDLYFVGQLPAYLNYRDLAIPESLQPVFKSISDRVAFEGLKDFALNTYFRTDVFVKGRVGRDETAMPEYLDTTPFALDSTSREAVLPNHTLRFRGAIFDSIFDHLRRGASTLADLESATRVDSSRARDAILHLLLADRITPMQTKTTPPAIGTLDVSSPYNRWVLLQRGFSPDVPIVLASKVLGNGVQLSMVEAAALRVALFANDAERIAWIREFCEESLTHLVVGDRRVEDKRELEGVVTREVERFRVERLAKMIELGVIESQPITS